MTAALALLVPTRNRPQSLAATLERALACARAAGPGNVDVVVCDQSAQPCRPQAGLRVLHRPDLSGLPAARNVLLAATQADLVCFLDDDTDLARDFAVELLRLAGAEPDLVAWGPVVEVRSRWQRRLHRMFQLGVFHDPRRHLGHRADRPTAALFGCCFAVRRRWAERVEFDARRPGYALGEDLDFFLRLAQHVGPGHVRFARSLRARHRRDGGNRAGALARGRIKGAFLLWLARRHGAHNPATLLHLALALACAAGGFGMEPGSWRGVWQGLRMPPGT